mmetsp:Transcript_1198/g.1952  ORF Transcript_1198/g.1952 Transcript_1198/m.1952 type:complete len:200 (+) Transcript_1198:729-1328(+)
MGRHHTPTVLLGQLHCIDRLGDGTNLVHFEEKGIACLLLGRLVDAADIGDQQIISNHLDVLANRCRELRIASPVILIEGVFDGHDRVLLREVNEDGRKCTTSQYERAIFGRGLEVEIVVAIRSQKLRRSHIHADFHLFLIASLLDSLHQKINTLIVTLNRRSKSTFISYIAGILAVFVLDHRLERMVDFATHDHRFCKR